MGALLGVAICDLLAKPNYLKTMQHLEISNKAARTLGLHFGLGLIAAVGTVMILAILLQLLLNVFGMGTDATDQDAWNRSGMRLHKDAETGIEYLSTSGGGLTPRSYR
jgi:hypothetical protein